MRLSVDNIVEGALKVLKREPKRKIAIYRNEIGTIAVEQAFQELEISYRVIDDRQEFDKLPSARFYTIDLSALQLEESQPDLDKLRDYWKKAPVPKSL